MTAAELDRIEAALGRPLPAAYRRFVTTCPPAEWRRHFPCFYSRPRKMIWHNRSLAMWADERAVREPDGAGGWTPHRPWPADWLAVGDGDSEWYYFLRPGDDGIWEWQHDGNEVKRVADSFEAWLAASQAEKGVAAPPEKSAHPTLGELTWWPDYGNWSLDRPTPDGGTVAAFINPRGANQEAFLAVAADLLPRAVAGEPAVLAAAMAGGGWADFLEYKCDGPAGLTAATVRGYLSWDGVSVRDGAAGPEVHYQYEADERIGMDRLLVTADAELRPTEHVWLL